MPGLIETIFQNININTLNKKELKDAILYLDFLISKETDIYKVLPYFRTKLEVLQKLDEIDRDKYTNFC